ncbi:hypothetical protein PoB_000273500 [Plakobranchus ocellatus]|uniref:Uncharacterized protein n=1 Tax=Plakobranchus ocellatus TaxID=259542 RepID=A0AAV3XZY9_9GAST|nr:hypothetical protein PoB_000273500 [Plakobranchus ocellatus]
MAEMPALFFLQQNRQPQIPEKCGVLGSDMDRQPACVRIDQCKEPRQEFRQALTIQLEVACAHRSDKLENSHFKSTTNAQYVKCNWVLAISDFLLSKVCFDPGLDSEYL